MKRASLILLLILTSFVGPLQAQTYVTDFKRTADNYFAQKDYYSAAQYYSKALGTFTVKPGEYKPYLVEKNGKSKQKKLKEL